MSDFTVTLKKPVTADGRELTSLTLRELVVSEILALEKSNANKTDLETDVAFFAMSAGVSPETIGKLCQSDWNKLRAKYGEVMGNE